VQQVSKVKYLAGLKTPLESTSALKSSSKLNNQPFYQVGGPFQFFGVISIFTENQLFYYLECKQL
jgi:hypothetical protein